MSQTLSIFVDSYRELNARKMFWVTLILSGVFMLAFALFGATDNELTLLTMSWPMPGAKTFYKLVLLRTVLITIWISWAAVILALISTSGVFPDFIAGGSIDLYLAKPIGRLRLFLTKYLAALLFVILQSTVFAVCAYLVVGIRAGEWKPGLFLTIPLLTLFFSYLYAVCVLVGVLTRSTIAALTATMLFWLFLFGLQWGEIGILAWKTNEQAIAEVQAERAERLDARLAKMPADRAAPSTHPADSGLTAEATASVDSADGGPAATRPVPAFSSLRRPQEVRDARDLSRRLSADASTTAGKVAPWHTALYALKTILPKTSDTIGVMDRTLFGEKEVEEMGDERNKGRRPRNRGQWAPEYGEDPDADYVASIQASERAGKRLSADIESRTPAWAIGTSLVFEGLVLGAAAWVFCRRDY